MVAEAKPKRSRRRALEFWVKGHPRTLKMTPFNRPYTTFYQSAVVTIAISCTIFELFDVQNIMTLKSSLEITQADSKWRHSIDRIRVPILPL